MTYDYTIENINNREVVQKNFVSLKSKADNYSGRHPSLNERFSVLERGFFLCPQLKKSQPRSDIRAIELCPKGSTSEFIQKLKNKTAAKTPASPSLSMSPPRSIDSVSP